MKPSNDEINQLFSNHKSALKAVKPMVDCFRQSTPKVSKNNKKELINYNAFDLVYKTFRSVNKQKGHIDNKVPDTDNIRKCFKDKFRNNRQDKYQAEEHLREMKSIKQRIENCGNIEQRKKRNYDPITHPTFLMRKASEGTKDISIQPFAKTVLQLNQPKQIIRPSSSKTYQKMTTTAAAHMRPSSAFHSQKQSQLGNSRFSQTHTTHNPKAKKRPVSSKPPPKPEPQFPECNFKSIITYIIDKKMFKDIDLRVLYERLCFKYGGQDIVDPIWDKVKSELEQ